jgi:hypothetical protein
MTTIGIDEKEPDDLTGRVDSCIIEPVSGNGDQNKTGLGVAYLPFATYDPCFH